MEMPQCNIIRDEFDVDSEKVDRVHVVTVLPPIVWILVFVVGESEALGHTRV